MGAEAVVTELTIDASGAEEGEKRYVRAMANAQAAMEKQIAVNTRLYEANDKQVKVTQQVAAANDNLASSWKSANDNVREAGRSILATGEEVAKITKHLLAAGIAAYNFFPAFRALANPSIANALKAIGPTAAASVGVAFDALYPLLALVSRFAVPIFALVTAWKGLNYVIGLGSGLLEKYANAGRSLFGENVDENLKKLTKFQNETLSAQQVQIASDLGQRLAEANRQIGDFFKVQFDLTDPALRLQSAWVAIVEAIAKGLSLLPQIPGMMAAAAQAIGNSSIWDKLNWGWNLPGKERLLAQNDTPDQSNAASLGAARGTLAGGLWLSAIGAGKDRELLDKGFSPTFGARFTGAVSAEKADEVNKLAGEFDRLERSMGRQAAVQQAEALAVGYSVGEHARLRTQMRLQEAALQDIEKHGGNIDDYADRIKKLADRYGEAAQRAAELKLQNDAAFERSQIGRDPVEANVASRLRSVYGDNYVNEMNSGLAATMRLTGTLKGVKQKPAEAAKGEAANSNQREADREQRPGLKAA